MGFRDDLQRAVANIRTRERLLQDACAEEAFRSILVGSPITGAPGQPVDSGALFKSWKKKKVGRREWNIESDSPYGDIIEENRRGATLRSSVGGFHSVLLTRLGWRRIVAYKVANLGSAGSKPSLIPNPQPRDRKGRFSWTKKARVRVRAG